MCLRFVFLLIMRTASWLRLSQREEAWKTAEILILRHQLAVLQRRQSRRPDLDWADRALLATLLAVIPKVRRHGLRLLVTPDTIVRWHRDIVHPLPGQCRDQLAAAGIRPGLRTVPADSGYVSEENFARAGQDRLRLLAPLAKAPDRRRSRPPERARHRDRYPATARAIRRMRHPRGPEDCKLRARTVEPVFGQLKTCQELTAMSRRGFTACESEWLLACTARHLRKLHRHRLQG
jgi:Transposase DDE domain